VEANRFVTTTRPWELSDAERRGDSTVSSRLDASLGVLLDTCCALARELGPFLPGAAARIVHALERRDRALGRALFSKVHSRPREA
jgi:methionyl-tRNA synthetase